MLSSLRTRLILCFLLLPATGLAQSTSELAPLGDKPYRTVLTEDHEPRMLEFKFVHDSGVRLRDGVFTGSSPELAFINKILQDRGATLRRTLFMQSEEWLDAWRESGEQRSGIRLHDLNLFFQAEFPADGLVASTCDALNRFELIEIAYPMGTVTDPSYAPVRMVGPDAPDFRSMQGYREAAPLGVDADYGNTFSGGRGEGTVIADVETGWTDDHEDIRHKALNQFVGLPPVHYPWDHGTAVLGELVGEDNDEGVLGICHQADVRMSSHQGSVSNIPTAIANGANAIGSGDALVLEVQCFAGPPAPHPCEYTASIFATCQTATANGKHVYAAAGNGNNDLDQAAYGGLFNKAVRDSGVVMVGASNGSSLDKASFSNYGSRLDAHGWGFNVTTTGYGDLFRTGSPPEPQEYTATFSGTSSATPIVTGAGVILNAIHREAFGSDMAPLTLRDLLTQTGTPQGSGGQIGPRPNIRAAIPRLGVPWIEIVGTLAPGSSYSVVVHGQPGDNWTLGYSKQFNDPPVHMPPFGYLYVPKPFNKSRSGVFGAGGTGTVNHTLPNNPNLSGRTIGYLQAEVSFNSGPGTGAYSNYIPMDVQ